MSSCFYVIATINSGNGKLYLAQFLASSTWSLFKLL